MLKITKEDLKALGTFYGTFNRRPDTGLYFSEKLLSTEDAAAYCNALKKLKKQWQKQNQSLHKKNK